MEALWLALGLNYKLLIAYSLNFIILLFILKKIGYKPLLAFIQDRTKKIETGIKNAELAKINLAKANTQKETIITNAHKEAQTIIEQAKQTAEEQAASLINTGRQEAEKLIKTAQAEIVTEQAEALKQAKREVADLVILTAEKLLEKTMNDSTNKTFVEKTLRELHG